MNRFLFFLVMGFGAIPLAFSTPVHTLISKAGSSAQFAKADYLAIFDSTKVQMQESGLSFYSEHQLIKILTPAGGKHFNVFKYDYDPLSAFVEIQKIIIYYKNGKERELTLKDEIDYPAPAGTILWGARQKMTELGRLEAGDAFEVFVTKKGFTYALLDQQSDDEKYIPPMKGHFYDIVPFWSDSPELLKVYQVSIPNSKTVNYQVYNGKLNVSTVKGAENTVYTFSLLKIMPVTPEPGMVALSDVAPKLLISTSPDWQAKSKWFYKVNEDYGSFKSTPEIDQKVKEILKGAGSELDSVSRLTHWVADELRYLGLSMGKGEGFTLHRGSMDFLDRCGVCKDKAGMLVTMLRSAGFEAYPSMTMAGSRIDRIPADQFNHSVVVVKLSDGKLHPLDPTWVPFVRELWSSAEQQQNYLPGIPGGSDLLETPVSAPQNHYVKIYATSELNKEGTLTGEISVTAEGQSDASLRRMFSGSFKALWKNNLENELLKISPQAMIVKSSFGDDPYNYMAGPISLTISYIIPDYATVANHSIVFTPMAGTGIFLSAMRHLMADVTADIKLFPFRDGCSRSIEITDKTTLPAGFKLSWTPTISKVAGTGATFEGAFTLTGNQLLLNERADFNKRIYAPEDWPSYRNAVKMQKAIAENPVILTL
ncbi:MAG: DUF3857 and transglutaminase domain-containing protein [Mariniphaga sp.]